MIVVYGAGTGRDGSPGAPKREGVGDGCLKACWTLGRYPARARWAATYGGGHGWGYTPTT